MQGALLAGTPAGGEPPGHGEQLFDHLGRVPGAVVEVFPQLLVGERRIALRGELGSPCAHQVVDAGHRSAGAPADLLGGGALGEQAIAAQPLVGQFSGRLPQVRDRLAE